MLGGSGGSRPDRFLVLGHLLLLGRTDSNSFLPLLDIQVKHSLGHSELLDLETGASWYILLLLRILYLGTIREAEDRAGTKHVRIRVPLHHCFTLGCARW